MCEATGLPDDLIAQIQEFNTPVTSAEANPSFQLNCLITIGVCSILALASLIVALTFPPLALAGGITATLSLGAGLTAFGLYKRSQSCSNNDLVKVEDESHLPHVQEVMA